MVPRGERGTSTALWGMAMGGRSILPAEGLVVSTSFLGEVRGERTIFGRGCWIVGGVACWGGGLPSRAKVPKDTSRC